MKIDWTQTFLDTDGVPIPETKVEEGHVVVKRDADGKAVPLTLCRACINALYTEFVHDNQTGAQKWDRAQLAYEIANEDMELSKEQLELVKERIGRIYIAELVWHVWNALDGRME